MDEGDNVECANKGKWFTGCYFVPRYDTSAIDTTNLNKVNIPAWEDAVPILDTMRHVTYVADVCIRCGKQVNRSSAAEESRKETK